MDGARRVWSDGLMKGRRGGWLAGFWLLAGAIGCPEGEADGPSIVLENFVPPDVAEPRETWKHGPSGLSFTTPGGGWARVEGEALAALGPEVVLAVREGKRCSGWALTRAADPDGARAAADRARSTLTWEGLQVQVDEDVKYDLWTARRYEVQGQLQGRTTAERATYWISDGRLYAVVARTEDRDYTSRRRCLDRVTAGFALGIPE